MSSKLYSVLNLDYLVFQYIGPALGIKTLLKPELRDIPTVKKYIKYIHEKQKKDANDIWLDDSDGNAHEYCELVDMFHSAAKNGLIDIVKYLLDIDNALIHVQDDCGRYVVENAISHLNLFKMLVKDDKGYYLSMGDVCCDEPNNTLLLEAIRCEYYDVAKWIIEYVIEEANPIFYKIGPHCWDDISLDKYLNCVIETDEIDYNATYAVEQAFILAGSEQTMNINKQKTALQLMQDKVDTFISQQDLTDKKYILCKDIIKLLKDNGAKEVEINYSIDKMARNIINFHNEIFRS